MNVYCRNQVIFNSSVSQSRRELQTLGVSSVETLSLIVISGDKGFQSAFAKIRLGEQWAAVMKKPQEGKLSR